MKTDMHNSVRAVTAIKPVALTTVAGVSGKIIDRKGYNGVEMVVSYGEITATDATLTFTLLEGDATGSMTSVANADLLGTEVLASVAAAATRTSGTSKNVTKRLGYKGNKRYVQPKVSSTVTAATVISAQAILHTPDSAPTSNP